MKPVFFEFYIRDKKVKMRVKKYTSIWSNPFGLMFRRKSLPLLFEFDNEKIPAIHSFFCQPFFAIWISSSGKATKLLKINKWRPHFFGDGRYLLEIPKSDENYWKMTKMLNLPDGK